MSTLPERSSLSSKFVLLAAVSSSRSSLTLLAGLALAGSPNLILDSSDLGDLDLTVTTDFEDGSIVAQEAYELGWAEGRALTDGPLEFCFRRRSFKSHMRWTRSPRLYNSGRMQPRRRTPRLCGGPHARGLVARVCIMNPKKPNSAMRHVAKLKLYRKPRITARIPGRGYGVGRFSRVLARGGRANDLPGVGYSLCRGTLDFSPLFGKKKRRSFYGLSRPADKVKPRRGRRQ